MIYTLEGDELVPHEKYWGSIPKIEMLQETSILVFDFGSEMYVWSGKNARLDKKRLTLKLAKEMWEEGYNYTECNVCPLNIASILGDREQSDLPRKADKRPDWALFAKITQHRETVLFREKFLDWPDYSRVIRTEVSGTYDIRPCDVEEMLSEKEADPDLVIENIHLGRGDTYFDEETRRLFEYDTLEGNFTTAIVIFTVGNTGRRLKGGNSTGNLRSTHKLAGERSVFFCWHGSNSSITEKCTAAFLTVELDKQNAPQVRVVQGFEPAAFLRLFKGNMVIHNGKRDEAHNLQKPRLFIVRGEVEDEIYLMEVPLEMNSLRSRSSFVIIDTEGEQITVWHGAKSSRQKRKVIKDAVCRIMKNKPAELYLDEFEEDLDVVEMDEGSESEDFFDIMGNNRDGYMSLLDCEESYKHTLRMFRLSSVTGSFVATEVLCPHRSQYSSPYPFVQSELYSASQPALFLIDNRHEMWLWQGWWPEKEDEMDLSDQTGSGAVRWQGERKAAMQTAVNYWNRTHEEGEPVVAYLVWAGLEPLQFKNLFPTWHDRGRCR
ncbi:hypothetical protein NQ317_012117 [Molorchus minor]|uniref:Gelsolin-like domain-containing protein n=1 Tax=Molorchus minor TaxID=1323400 RepID=A0ABQ9J936_9CUCU|nr:hypothetical protein NQ317_012117 [Molorchus minor]